MLMGKAAAPAPKPEKSTGTVIGSTIVLENVSIRGIGNLRIEGSVTGRIELEGHLTIDRGGKLDGEVIAAGATVSGLYKGEITTAGTLHITSSAQIIGCIKAGKMIVDEGASISAACFANEQGLPAREKEKEAELQARIEAEHRELDDTSVVISLEAFTKKENAEIIV